MGKPSVLGESSLSHGRLAVWLRKKGKRMLAPH